MSEAKTWKRKQRYSASVSAARAAKQRKLQLDSDAMSASSSGDVPLYESLVLPRVEPEIDEQVDSEDEEFSENTAQEFYKEWIECQPKYTIKIMAVVLMDTFRIRFGLTDVAAAKEAGLVVGFNEKTICMWRNNFYECKGGFSDSVQGKQPSVCIG